MAAAVKALVVQVAEVTVEASKGAAAWEAVGRAVVVTEAAVAVEAATVVAEEAVVATEAAAPEVVE